MIISEEPPPSDPESAVRLPEVVMERLRLRANHLKMLPAVAAQALEIVKDPDCSIHEFSAVVERDAALAADILRLANSIQFSGSRTVLNLHQAVVRLGLRQSKNLIMAASFSSMMKRLTLSEERIREWLWRHGFITALLAMNLNQSLDIGFQGEEFAGGLIHDIGRMLLVLCFPEDFGTIDPMTPEEGPDTLNVESRLIGTNHCEVGAWFIQKNALPQLLYDTVRFHHTPERSEHHRKFVALISTCDHMANYLQFAGSPRGYEPQRNSAVGVLEACGITGATRRFQEIATEVMETADRNAAEMLGS